jgi:hypothetical protein
MSDEENTSGSATTWAWVAGFAALAVLHRLVPYLFDLGPEARFAWNFAPVGAVGLFAGARLRSRWDFLAPLAVMVVSDLLLWPLLSAKGLAAFSWGTPIIYGSFVVYALIGRGFRGTFWPFWIVGGASLGALQFFLVTNFAVWLGDGVTYARSLTGLTQCYVAALPFFGATLGGDLFYSGLFFGLHALSLVVFQRQKASQPA